MSSKEISCEKICESKALEISEKAVDKVKNGEINKINLIWLEANGCSGNIISLLDASNPQVGYFLKEMVNMTYDNSIMAEAGEKAYERFLDTLNTEFILAVEGAVSIKDEGKYNIMAFYKGKDISAGEAVKQAALKAKYIVAVGTCASNGGITGAYPNPSTGISLQNFLDRPVINLPGCPCNPHWVIGTIAHLILKGVPELDSENRPKIFYGITIHDRCPRRGYFEKKIFAKALGDKECMFKLGCRGPVTRTDCPIVEWNDHASWPIGINTPCIGCANSRFPDKMEPFIKY